MEEIGTDYKALAEGLMRELEDARRAIADMHFAKNRVHLWQRYGVKDAVQFIEYHQITVYLAIVLLTIVVRLVLSWRRKRGHKE